MATICVVTGSYVGVYDLCCPWAGCHGQWSNASNCENIAPPAASLREDSPVVFKLRHGADLDAAVALRDCRGSQESEDERRGCHGTSGKKLAPKVAAIFYRKSKFCSWEGRCLEEEDEGKAPVKKPARDSRPKMLKNQAEIEKPFSHQYQDENVKNLWNSPGWGP